MKVKVLSLSLSFFFKIAALFLELLKQFYPRKKKRLSQTFRKITRNSYSKNGWYVSLKMFLCAQEDELVKSFFFFLFIVTSPIFCFLLRKTIDLTTSSLTDWPNQWIFHQRDRAVFEEVLTFVVLPACTGTECQAGNVMIVVDDKMIRWCPLEYSAGA